MTTTEMNLISFLKTTDVYDPDKISSDEDLIRRFYLRNATRTSASSARTSSSTPRRAATTS